MILSENNNRAEKDLDRYEKMMRFYENSSNQIYIDLTKQLITLNSGLIIFISVFVKFSNTESTLQKYLIIAIWSFLAFSIFFGLLQLYIESVYYKSVSDLYHRLILILSNSELDEKSLGHSYDEQDLEIDRSFKPNSTQMPFIFQMVFFILSLILIVCLLIIK